MYVTAMLIKTLTKEMRTFLINYAGSAGDPCISYRSTINNVKDSSVSLPRKTTIKLFHLYWVRISLKYIEHFV